MNHYAIRIETRIKPSPEALSLEELHALADRVMDHLLENSTVIDPIVTSATKPPRFIIAVEVEAETEDEANEIAEVAFHRALLDAGLAPDIPDTPSFTSVHLAEA